MNAKLTSADRAARLPAPVPGTVVTVPLALWPAYQELHGLEAMTAGEISACEKRNPIAHKAGGPVWVKHTEEKE